MKRIIFQIPFKTRSITSIQRCYATTSGSAKLTFDQYPFLKELGLTAENNPGAYYNGKWHHGKEMLVIVNPATDESIATVSIPSADQYHSLTSNPDFVKAKHAWAHMPAPLRGEIIRQIGDRLRQKRDDLGKLVSLEVCFSIMYVLHVYIHTNNNNNNNRWVRYRQKVLVRYKSLLTFVIMLLVYPE